MDNRCLLALRYCLQLRGKLCVFPPVICRAVLASFAFPSFSLNRFSYTPPSHSMYRLGADASLPINEYCLREVVLTDFGLHHRSQDCHSNGLEQVQRARCNTGNCADIYSGREPHRALISVIHYSRDRV
jgi:hypothetical protein